MRQLIPTPSTAPHAGAASEPAGRAVGVLLLLAVGLVHLLDAPQTYHDTRYVFWMYIALMAGTVIVAALLLHTGAAWAWAAAGAMSALVLAGYLLSRTTGLPGSGDDVGNWLDPLGLASVWLETALVLLSAYGAAIARVAASADPAQRRVLMATAPAHPRYGLGRAGLGPVDGAD
jgi:hypothetical protein